MTGDLLTLSRGRRTLRLLPFVVTSTIAILGWWLASWVVVAQFTMYAVVALVLGVAGGPQVLLEPDALVVRRRRSEQRYAWATILEGSWGHGGLFRSGPMVRTVGSPHATPGPIAPVVVASWLLPGRIPQQRFAAACEAHGIPYTPKLVRLIMSGQRKPRLPGDGQREALLRQGFSGEARGRVDS